MPVGTSKVQGATRKVRPAVIAGAFLEISRKSPIYSVSKNLGIDRFDNLITKTKNRASPVFCLFQKSKQFSDEGEGFGFFLQDIFNTYYQQGQDGNV